MALKIAQSESFKWPVTVYIPADGGRYTKDTFDVEFKRISRSEAEELLRKQGLGEITGTDLVRAVMVGWSGVLDGGGEALPYSDATREILLDVAGVSNAILSAFSEAISGAARRKN